MLSASCTLSSYSIETSIQSANILSVPFSLLTCITLASSTSNPLAFISSLSSDTLHNLLIGIALIISFATVRTELFKYVSSPTLPIKSSISTLNVLIIKSPVMVME